MSEWISCKDRLPEIYPVFGINMTHKFKGVLLSKDDNNKASGYWFNVQGLPNGLSMPITH
jgi:hypothetical protein